MYDKIQSAIETLNMAVEWIEFQGYTELDSETLKKCKEAIAKLEGA